MIIELTTGLVCLVYVAGTLHKAWKEEETRAVEAALAGRFDENEMREFVELGMLPPETEGGKWATPRPKVEAGQTWRHYRARDLATVLSVDDTTVVLTRNDGQRWTVPLMMFPAYFDLEPK